SPRASRCNSRRRPAGKPGAARAVNQVARRPSTRERGGACAEAGAPPTRRPRAPARCRTTRNLLHSPRGPSVGLRVVPRRAGRAHEPTDARAPRVARVVSGPLESPAEGTSMLGFRLNEEQESFRLAVRAFAEKALAPRVEELERTETFPMDLFRLIEEFSRVNCGFAGALLAHVGLATIPLIELGTEEQKRTYLAAALRARSSDRSGSRSRIPARTPRPYGRRPSGAATTT